MARIRYVVDDWGACGWYRAHAPGMALKEAGHEVFLDGRVASREAPEWDVFVFQRQWRPGSIQTMDAAKKLGKKIVYELDDDLWTLHTSNPGYIAWNDPRRLGAAEYGLRNADVVTTTTPQLKQVLKRFNDNVVVLPNMLPREHWPAEPERTGDPDMLAIGWAGSASRQADLMEIAGVVEQLLDRYGEIEFLIAGSEQTPFREHPRIRRLDTVKIERYPSILSQFDIAVAPLADSRFNLAKSDLKFIEYAWMGLPVVASKVGSYERGIKPGETGLLARNPKDWLKHLRRLIEDEELRHRLGGNARKVALGRVMEDNIGLWETAYGLSRPISEGA